MWSVSVIRRPLPNRAKRCSPRLMGAEYVARGWHHSASQSVGLFPSHFRHDLYSYAYGSSSACTMNRYCFAVTVGAFYCETVPFRLDITHARVRSECCKAAREVWGPR